MGMGCYGRLIPPHHWAQDRALIAIVAINVSVMASYMALVSSRNTLVEGRTLAPVASYVRLVVATWANLALRIKKRCPQTPVHAEREAQPRRRRRNTGVRPEGLALILDRDLHLHFGFWVP